MLASMTAFMKSLHLRPTDEPVTLYCLTYRRIVCRQGPKRILAGMKELDKRERVGKENRASRNSPLGDQRIKRKSDTNRE
jgi:hypothetical protein